MTEADDHLFCLITMNHHPLHINDVYAAQSQQGRNVVVGPLVYSLALGMSVGDVSGKAIANLATDELSPPGAGLPRRHAVLRVRGARGQGVDAPSPTAAWCGSTPASCNQDGTLVAEFKRSVLVAAQEPRRLSAGLAASGQPPGLADRAGGQRLRPVDPRPPARRRGVQAQLPQPAVEPVARGGCARSRGVANVIDSETETCWPFTTQCGACGGT